MVSSNTTIINKEAGGSLGGAQHRVRLPRWMQSVHTKQPAGQALPSVGRKTRMAVSVREPFFFFNKLLFTEKNKSELIRIIQIP